MNIRVKHRSSSKIEKPKVVLVKYRPCKNIPVEFKVPETRWYFDDDKIKTFRFQWENLCNQDIRGQDEKTEFYFRVRGSKIIRNIGLELKAPQIVIDIATVYMHRFYIFHPVKIFPVEMVASSCFILSAKYRNYLVGSKAVTYAALKSISSNFSQNEYDEFCAQTLAVESFLLNTLNFELEYDHPYKYVSKALRQIGVDNNDLENMCSFNISNILSFTTFCLKYPPKLIAAFAIYSTNKIQYVINDKPWYCYIDENINVDILNYMSLEFDTMKPYIKSQIINRSNGYSNDSPRSAIENGNSGTLKMCRDDVVKTGNFKESQRSNYYSNNKDDKTIELSPKTKRRKMMLKNSHYSGNSSITKSSKLSLDKNHNAIISTEDKAKFDDQKKKLASKFFDKLDKNGETNVKTEDPITQRIKSILVEMPTNSTSRVNYKFENERNSDECNSLLPLNNYQGSTAVVEKKSTTMNQNVQRIRKRSAVSSSDDNSDLGYTGFIRNSRITKIVPPKKLKTESQSESESSVLDVLEEYVSPRPPKQRKAHKPAQTPNGDNVQILSSQNVDFEKLLTSSNNFIRRNPSVDNSMMFVNNSMMPVDNSMMPVDNSMMLVNNSMMPVDNSKLPVDNSMLEIDNSVMPVDDTMMDIDDSIMQIDNLIMPIGNSTMHVDNSITSIDNSTMSVNHSFNPINNSQNSIPYSEKIVDVNYWKGKLVKRQSKTSKKLKRQKQHNKLAVKHQEVKDCSEKVPVIENVPQIKMKFVRNQNTSEWSSSLI